MELDYVDHCEQRASATWNELTGNSKGLAAKVGSDFFAKTYSVDFYYDIDI